MIYTFIRSSSLKTYEICPHRFLIEWEIGIRQPPNRKMQIGNVIHSTLEKLAHSKLNGTNIDPYVTLDEVFTEYNRDFPGVFEGDSHSECGDLIEQVLTFQGGIYNPKNLNIWKIEEPFDQTIDKDWATYKFNTPNGTLEGQLALKGTIDLIIKHSEDTLEILDWKTGQKPYDYARGCEQTEQTLKYDTQILLYHYAVCMLYPKIDNVIFTIYYIRTNQPFTIILERKDLPKTEAILARKYRTIVNDTKPYLNISWRCNFCPFFKAEYKESGKTTCVFFRDEIIEKGYDKTMAEHADWHALTRYGSGGGKEDRE